jgi:UDP-N-acetylmuramyl tripeptide synthase
MMLQKQSIGLGKFVKKAMRLRGGGSALPGLVVEKLSPKFLTNALSNLPYGVVVVSGTNGKTTTTKIVVELLKAHGLRVFTNPSGSNFTRGVVASLLDHVDNAGHLDMDIAVVELDEAHAVHFARAVPPVYTLILNVFRDQLDRFGEIDHTAKLLGSVVESTTKGVVLNRDDELVRALAVNTSKDIDLRYFGVSDTLLKLFPSDATMRGTNKKKAKENDKRPAVSKNDVILSKLSGQKATFTTGEVSKSVSLRLAGIYNVQNAAAALSLTRMVLGDAFSTKKAYAALEEVRPAFGRGEAVAIDGKPLEIVLVKNPSGFRLSLASYKKKPAATMIAINDLYADGRDMSWLWDVDFSDFVSSGIPFVSGIRAYDMALRLQYDGVEVGQILPDTTAALAAFLASVPGPKRIFCTYTAMFAIRRELAKLYPLEAIE